MGSWKQRRKAARAALPLYLQHPGNHWQVYRHVMALNPGFLQAGCKETLKKQPEFGPGVPFFTGWPVL